MSTIPETITIETISLFVGLIIPIAGIAFGLGTLSTRLHYQNNELNRLRDMVQDLQIKLGTYLNALEESRWRRGP